MKLLKPHYKVPLEPAIKNMRNPVCLPLLSLLICSLFISCDNEIDLLDDYREIPVVYGIINPSATTHYVRIQKSFLGPGNALLMAQKGDSIYYDTSRIRIYIEKIFRDNVVDSKQLKPDFSKEKEEGIFSNQDHRVYRIDNYLIYTGSNTANQDTNYRIRFYHLTSGIESVAVMKPAHNISFGTFSPSTRINLVDDMPFAIKFNSSRNGKVYGLTMRINYIVFDNLNNTSTSSYIDYVLPNVISPGLLGGESLSFLLDGTDIFKFIGSKIQKPIGSKTISANSFKADFYFYIGSEELFNYYTINSPNNTVNFIPQFTNLTYGMGIFCSRNETSVKNLGFTERTYDSLETSIYTRHIFQ